VTDFLMELGTEELPPKSLRELEKAFATSFTTGLDQAGIAHGEIQSFAAPRRIAVLVKRLAPSQPEQHIKRKGHGLTALDHSVRGMPGVAPTSGQR
jgi:glycyl-tRNA synthetase beta chain